MCPPTINSHAGREKTRDEETDAHTHNASSKDVTLDDEFADLILAGDLFGTWSAYV